MNLNPTSTPVKIFHNHPQSYHQDAFSVLIVVSSRIIIIFFHIRTPLKNYVPGICFSRFGVHATLLGHSDTAATVRAAKSRGVEGAIRDGMAKKLNFGNAAPRKKAL
jgi:hypothetical protein